MVKNARDLIITLPNKHLRQASESIEGLDSRVKKVINNMKLATIDWEDHRDYEVGVALAAIQIDQPYRIVIVREDFDDKNNHKFMVLINPEVIKQSGKLVDDYEGCLSVQDVYGRVPRFEKITIRALNEQGQKIKFSTKGFMARVLQHEIDHLNGKLFVDLIKQNKNAFYKLDDTGQLIELDYVKDIKQSDLFG